FLHFLFFFLSLFSFAFPFVSACLQDLQNVVWSTCSEKERDSRERAGAGAGLVSAGNSDACGDWSPVEGDGGAGDMAVAVRGGEENTRSASQRREKEEEQRVSIDERK
ncbi:unnamed protein product, partial [Prunus brigantina]